MTPLHVAVQSSSLKATRMLLAKGAKIDIRDQQGRTPYVFAREVKETKIAVLLEQIEASDQAGLDRVKTLAEIEQRAKEKRKDAAAAAPPKKNALPLPAPSTVPMQRPTKSPGLGIPVEIGVYCVDLRYDEEEHGSCLPPEFKRARAAWVKSGNDPESGHYATACRLLDKWVECNFAITQGASVSLTLDGDNQVSGFDQVTATGSADRGIVGLRGAAITEIFAGCVARLQSKRVNGAAGCER